MSHRLVFVTGKGGVGKSTVAAAMAILGAKRGARTLLIELAGQDRVRRAFARRGALSDEVRVAPRLFTITIDPAIAMDEYLRVRMGGVGRALGGTPLFQAFSETTPGMREMQTMAKIWELAHPNRPAGSGRPYDLVIVDAPATGHAVGLLRIPRTYAALARVGPIASGARRIAKMLADPAFTGFIAVTTADELAVNETLFLEDELASDGLSVSALVLNRLHPDRFTAGEAAELERFAGDPGNADGAIRAALFAHRRAEEQRIQTARLRNGVAAPLVVLPFAFTDALGRDALLAAADRLAHAWPGSGPAADPHLMTRMPLSVAARARRYRD